MKFYYLLGFVINGSFPHCSEICGWPAFLQTYRIFVCINPMLKMLRFNQVWICFGSSYKKLAQTRLAFLMLSLSTKTSLILIKKEVHVTWTLSVLTLPSSIYCKENISEITSTSFLCYSHHSHVLAISIELESTAFHFKVIMASMFFFRIGSCLYIITFQMPTYFAKA